MSKLDELNQNINILMSGVITHFKQNNISLIMPTYVPQRGEILREFAQQGISTFIAGGYRNTQTFAEIPQKGLPGAADRLPFRSGYNGIYFIFS